MRSSTAPAMIDNGLVVLCTDRWRHRVSRCHWRPSNPCHDVSVDLHVNIICFCCATCDMSTQWDKGYHSPSPDQYSRLHTTLMTMVSTCTLVCTVVVCRLMVSCVTDCDTARQQLFAVVLSQFFCLFVCPLIFVAANCRAPSDAWHSVSMNSV